MASSREQHLYYDSQLPPKDKVGITKDELLMKEFEPDGNKEISDCRKDNVFSGRGQDKLQE